MTYGEMRRLFSDVHRSAGRFEVWSARCGAPAAAAEPTARCATWSVVLIDTHLARTYEVRDYAVVARSFPALPERSEPGLLVGWLPAAERPDGYLRWAQVRTVLHALERAYPVCQLDALERSLHGWACVIACAPKTGHARARGSMCRAEVYVPGDTAHYYTALTADAVETLVAACTTAA